MCIGSLGNTRRLILKTRVFWTFSLYIMNAERSALCNSAIYFVLPLWKSGGTNKCNFQKHAVAPWRRQMWKEDGLHLQPWHPAGLSPALSRRRWVPSCLSGGGPGSSELLHSAAADPAAFLLHYPDVCIVDAISLSGPQFYSKADLVYLKEKVFHLPLSKYSPHSKYSPVWLWSCVQLHRYKADLNEIQTKILVQFGEKTINRITGLSW